MFTNIMSCCGRMKNKLLNEEPVEIIWMRDCDLAMCYGMEVVRRVII